METRVPRPEATPLERSPEVREQVIELEDRLERAQLRRTGLPVAFVVFAVLAFVLLGDQIRDVARGTPTFFWILLFGGGCGVGLVLNEVITGRVVRALNRELDGLRTSPRPEELPEAGKSGEE